MPPKRATAKRARTPEADQTSHTPAYRRAQPRHRKGHGSSGGAMEPLISSRAEVDAKADVNAKDDECRRALHFAAASGIVGCLISKRAEVNAADNGGMTALHYAVNYGHLSSVEDLIKKGADVNAKANHHETPLHYADQASHSAIAARLVRHAANK